MDYIKLGNKLEPASQLALGCMRLAEHSEREIVEVLEIARELGINFFDHADVYSDGQSEAAFGRAIKQAKIPRDQLLLQSKCGLRDVHENYHFDASRDHILASVEASLSRLQTDYLDLLLLHRPDALVQPEEVAEAFYILRKSGKVRSFGVSNHNPYQIALLQQSLEQPLLVNQLQFGPAHTPMLDAGLNTNMLNDLAVNRDGSVLDYCRLHGLTVQPWSPFQVDLNQGLFMAHPQYQVLTETLQACAQQYGVSFEALVLAWILRHPARMQPIVGSMNPQRLRSLVQAFDIQLTRADWYRIYKSAGRPLP